MTFDVTRWNDKMYTEAPAPWNYWDESTTSWVCTKCWASAKDQTHEPHCLTHPLPQGYISYEGIDEADLILALHNGTMPRGLGHLHNRPGLTIEEVRQDLMERFPATETRLHFDYYYGRPLKVTLLKDRKIFQTRLYDRDAGPGAAEYVVNALRART